MILNNPPTISAQLAHAPGQGQFMKLMLVGCAGSWSGSVGDPACKRQVMVEETD